MKLIAVPVIAPIIAVAACAGSARPMATPKLQAPLDSLAFYVGDWQCKGTSFPVEDQKEEHWDAEVIVAPELDGRSLSVRMIGPGDNRTSEHKGYDPETKQWYHLAVGNSGSWGSLRSPGWEGTHMTFTPDDKADPSVSTFTKLGEREYSHAVSEHGTKVWEKVCTKAS